MILKFKLPDNYHDFSGLKYLIYEMSSLREVTITVDVDIRQRSRKLRRSLRSLTNMESDLQPLDVNLHVLATEWSLPSKAVLRWLRTVPRKIQIRTLKLSLSDTGSRYYTSEFVRCLQGVKNLIWKDPGDGLGLCSKLAEFPQLEELDLCKSSYFSGENRPVPDWFQWNLGNSLTRLYVPLALFQKDPGSSCSFDSVRFLYLDNSLLWNSDYSTHLPQLYLPFHNLDSLRFVVTGDTIDSFCNLVQANPYLTRLATGFVSTSTSCTNALMCRAASFMGGIEHLEIASPTIVDLSLLLQQPLSEMLTLKVPELARDSVIQIFQALNRLSAAGGKVCSRLTSIRGYRIQPVPAFPAPPAIALQKLFLLYETMSPQILSWIRNSEQPFEKGAPNILINVRELRSPLITSSTESDYNYEK